MRSITQSRELAALRQWKKVNRATPQVLTYPPPGDVLRSIKAALHAEQAGLCAYTLQHLPSPEHGHLEHIEPRKHQPNKALEYTNMVLCFPANGGDTSYGYGAPVKGSKPVSLNVNFVSPHSGGCEKRFIYKLNGEVLAPLGDNAAEETIKSINLNCEQLKELRQAAIVAQGISLRKGRARKPINLRTASEAKRLAKDILHPNAHGLLSSFCVAISQVAAEYSKNEQYRAKQLAKKKKR